jgi:hypothetical protein
MEDASSSLESYLSEAHIDYVGDFAGGGGHADKQLVVLRGGVGALAKLGREEPARRQCRAEVAAYHVAQALGWADLVSVTVYREVPTREGGSAEASVQVEWPRFQTAQELGRNVDSLEESEALRIAVLDVLLMNADRNDQNWGFVGGTKLALVDHGNSGMSGMDGGPSAIAHARRNRDLEAEHVEALEALVEAINRLKEAIGEENAQAVLDRANRMLQAGAVAFDG